MQLKVDIKDLIPLCNAQYVTEEEDEAIKKLGDYIRRMKEIGFHESTGKPMVVFQKEGEYLIINIEQERIVEQKYKN